MANTSVKRVTILPSPDSAVLRRNETSVTPRSARTLRSQAGRSTLLRGSSLAMSAMILKSTPSWLNSEW